MEEEEDEEKKSASEDGSQDTEVKEDKSEDEAPTRVAPLDDGLMHLNSAAAAAESPSLLCSPFWLVQ
ncbi:Protein of unknown function [Pyronema omphalodes CBS 100304]|uniref:Uncharacterized protein n=1 Tax=Pyronema omphalodes (strain CBS 100304) TaxID=1076935 RepID=U4L5E0_PYROM|nr:Protein of unknown function [Pyronema omphalodes CBS 100304]